MESILSCQPYKLPFNIKEKSTDDDARHSREEVASTMACLQCLPTELLLFILDYVPVSSKVCLIITSKRIYFRLGGVSAQSTILRRVENWEQKLALLRLLERDLPNSFACEVCIGLHFTLQQRPLEHDFSPSQLCQNPRGHVLLWPNEYLSFDFISASIQQRNTKALRRENRQQCIDISTNWRVRSSTKPKRRLGRLVLSTIVLFDQTEEPDDSIRGATGPCILDLAYIFDLDRNFKFPVCAHSNVTAAELQDSISQRPANQQIFARISSNGSVANKCPFCPTEWIIFSNVFRGMLSLLVEIWRDVGTGVNSNDGEWESQRYGSPLRRYVQWPGRNIADEWYNDPAFVYNLTETMRRLRR